MTTQHVDFNKKIGGFKPVNGVGNYDAAAPEEFFKMSFPSVRLHDMGGERPFCVDVGAIFPVFERDENEPESYDFRHTDLILGDLISHGVEVIYRLGPTIDHTPFPRLSCPPQDNAKWARICEHIICHYNKGWAKGFEYGIRYWEIWNEPDLIYLGLHTMWQGSESEFFELYRVASTHLKACFPDLLIGGYGAARTRAPFFENFLAFARENALPLDFFSWHRYGSEVEEVVAQANRVRELLDAAGYGKTESILDEWSYTENYRFGENAWGLIGNDPTVNEAFFTRMRNQVGASYAVSVMIALLDAPVDAAHFYDAQRGAFGALFDSYGNHTKLYSALIDFNRLVGRGTRVYAESGLPEVWLAAGADENFADVVISCFEAKGCEVDIRLENVKDYREASVWVTNDFCHRALVGTYSLGADNASLPVSIRPYTVITITLKKIRSVQYGFRKL